MSSPGGPVEGAASFRHDRAGTSAQTWRDHPGWTAMPTWDPLAAMDRLVVLAAHPDDECLGAGALLARAADRGLRVDLVTATLGEASHPHSPTHSPTVLADLRRSESRHALATLAPAAAATFLDLPDGGLSDHTEDLTASLVELVGDGTSTLLVAPWRRDGHRDHDAAGTAAAAAAVRTGCRLAAYPIWWWHWSTPEAADWSVLRAVPVSPSEARRKQVAIAAHRTQVEPLSAAAGDEVLLGPDLLAHFGGEVEVFVDEPAVDGALDSLHATATDPWGVDRRWYERRKRDLLLAVLPRPRFARALEVGCSTGALTAALATRCEEVVGLDDSPAALDRARARLADVPTVTLTRARVPHDWPDGAFDLVVVAEVGYFLGPPELRGLLAAVDRGRRPDTVVVACHWRHPVHGWVLDGPAVHERMEEAWGPPAARYADTDVEILVWADAGSMPDPHAG